MLFAWLKLHEKQLPRSVVHYDVLARSTRIAERKSAAEAWWHACLHCEHVLQLQLTTPFYGFCMYCLSNAYESFTCKHTCTWWCLDADVLKQDDLSPVFPRLGQTSTIVSGSRVANGSEPFSSRFISDFVRNTANLSFCRELTFKGFSNHFHSLHQLYMQQFTL